MLSGKRQKFSRAERVVGRKLSFMSANSWTGLSILCVLAAAYLVARNEFILGAGAFAIASLCDAVDGAVARHKGTAGKYGAFLDTIVDRYVEFFIILGLFFASLPDAVLPANLWLFIYMFGAMMTTYTKAAAREKDIIKEEMRHGILERPERLSLLFLGLLLAGINAQYLTYMIILLSILAHITALQRISKAFRG